MKAKYINEKFTEDGDPIHDMGIGIFVERDFNSKEEMYNFIADNIESIFKVEKLPKCFMCCKKGGSGASIKTKNADYLENFMIKYFTIKNGKVLTSKGLELFDLASALLKLKKGVVVLNKMDWEGKNSKLDPPIYENLNEKFTEDGDPVRDMGIGLAALQKEYESIQAMNQLPGLNQKEITQMEKICKLKIKNIYYLGNNDEIIRNTEYLRKLKEMVDPENLSKKKTWNAHYSNGPCKETLELYITSNGNIALLDNFWADDKQHVKFYFGDIVTVLYLDPKNARVIR